MSHRIAVVIGAVVPHQQPPGETLIHGMPTIERRRPRHLNVLAQ
jgi:hypothetical protein